MLDISTSLIIGSCFEWNGYEWESTAPTNPVDTVCGLSICTPCDSCKYNCSGVF